MSLRTGAKKQKPNSNAEKILRPPPLISDFNSGVYLFNYCHCSLVFFLISDTDNRYKRTRNTKKINKKIQVDSYHTDIIITKNK